jgi:hypothetical protein
MAPSSTSAARSKLISDLADAVTRTALASANLTPEDRFWPGNVFRRRLGERQGKRTAMSWLWPTVTVVALKQTGSPAISTTSTGSNVIRIEPSPTPKRLLRESWQRRWSPLTTERTPLPRR